MAVVIPLAPQRRRRSRAAADGSTGAQILFFTGVRYERIAEPAPREAVARAARRAAAPKAAAPAKPGRRKARQPA